MTLLAPWALWLSCLGAAVVALYLLKIKRHRQRVPALDFWRRLAGPAPVRSLFERLKRWWSMLLWLLIVACLVLAVGNPVLALGRIRPRSIAIVVDNSASMQTLEDGETGARRLELAIQAVETLTSRRPVRDEWLLIEAGYEPRVRQAWTRDGRAVREAARALEPYAGAADLDAARELAAQLLAGKPRPLTVIVSDGAGGGLRLDAPASGPEREREDDDDDGNGDGRPEELHWPIGAARDNLGLVRLSVRPHRQQAMHHVYVRLVNAGPEPAQTQVIVEIDGSTRDVRPVTVEAGGIWEETLTVDAPAGGVLRASIDRPDALELDDEAYAILDPIEPASILLVTPPEEAYFYEQALAAMDDLVDAAASGTTSLEDYGPGPSPGTLDAGDAGAGDGPDLTLFNNGAPPRLPASGQLVFVNGWPEDLPARVVGELERPRLALVDREHPLCRHLDLRPVALARAREVDLTAPATVLARAGDGAPLIFLYERPDLQALCLAFDVLESDLPFRNAFPILLRNAVAVMAPGRRPWLLDQYRVGEIVEPLRRLPESCTEVTVARRTGDGETAETLPVHEGVFALPLTAPLGPLRFELPDGPAYAAVNLADERESRVAPLAPGIDVAARLPLSDPLLGTVPWLALAGLATLLVALEWLTFHRRWTE